MKAIKRAALNNPDQLDPLVDFLRGSIEEVDKERNFYVSQMNESKGLLEHLKQDLAKVQKDNKAKVEALVAGLKKAEQQKQAAASELQRLKQELQNQNAKKDAVAARILRIKETYCRDDRLKGESSGVTFNARIKNRSIQSKYDPYSKSSSEAHRLGSSLGHKRKGKGKGKEDENSQSSECYDFPNQNSEIFDQREKAYDQADDEARHQLQDMLVANQQEVNAIQKELQTAEREQQRLFDQLGDARLKKKLSQLKSKGQFEKTGIKELTALKQFLQGLNGTEQELKRLHQQNDRLRQSNLAKQERVEKCLGKTLRQNKGVLNQDNARTHQQVARLQEEVEARELQFTAVRRQYQLLQLIFQKKLQDLQSREEQSQQQYKSELSALQTELRKYEGLLGVDDYKNVYKQKTIPQKLQEARLIKLQREVDELAQIEQEHKKCLKQFTRNKMFYEEEVKETKRTSLPLLAISSRRSKSRSKSRSKVTAPTGTRKRKDEPADDESLQLSSLQQIKKQIKQVEEQLQRQRG